MKKKEQQARRILKNAIEAVMELGYHVRTQSMGAVASKDGMSITNVEQLVLAPVPEEYKRRKRSDSIDTRS